MGGLEQNPKPVGKRQIRRAELHEAPFPRPRPRPRPRIQCCLLYTSIFKFPKRYPDAKVFKIETNYRSTPEILKVANAAIAANTEQFTKELAPARKSGLKPALVTCADAAQQAAFIAQRVAELPEMCIRDSA